MEDAQYAGGYNQNVNPRNDPHSNTYNTGLRNHPNFRWRDNDNVLNKDQAFKQPQYARPSTHETRLDELEKNIRELKNEAKDQKEMISAYQAKTESSMGEIKDMVG